MQWINWADMAIENKIAIGGLAATFLFGILRLFSYWLDRKLAKVKIRYEGESLIRHKQLETIDRIFRCIGVLTDTEDAAEYNLAWYELSQIYYGAAHLLDNEELHDTYWKFADEIWTHDTYDKYYKKMRTPTGRYTKAHGKLEDLAFALSDALNKYIREQFEFGKPIEISRKNKSIEEEIG